MLPEARSFYFRGPRGALNLRAQNLVLYLQIAAGVDDETWIHHLRQGDYSRWFREEIKDEDLADAVAAIERQPDLTPEATHIGSTAPVIMVGTGSSARRPQNPPCSGLTRASTSLSGPISPLWRRSSCESKPR